jgi:cobalt-precorrin-5B (C1)-methyltransferase
MTRSPDPAPDLAASPDRPLRKGWTTGACAAAAARSAFQALTTGQFADPVTIRLPRGERPSFALADSKLESGRAMAAIVKDAGDDPDITHGTTIRVTVERTPSGSGIAYKAGPGVGTVTKPGLALPVGEPAINPGPRAIIGEAIQDLAEALGVTPDLVLTIGIDGGEALALKTMNPRLGIIGGLSILGTTGIVVPYSCSAWIHSIHRGIDVARAGGLSHIAGATGATSEDAVRRLYGLDDGALIDMGDFVGGMLKYLRRHPVRRVTIAGGFGKLVKLAQGHLDLHSGRSRVDLEQLAQTLAGLGAQPSLIERARSATTAAEVQEMAAKAGIALGDVIAAQAREVALATLSGKTALDVVLFDRQGERIGHAGP